MTRGYSVVVVGAGPAGIAAAAGFAERGSDVLLLEAEPNAAKRLAGEWLHPLAAGHLERLGLLAGLPATEHAEGRGFAFFSDDGELPVLLPYADGERALAMEHGDLVSHLRERIAEVPGVTYLPHARLRALPNGMVSYTVGGTSHEARAGLVVGADGRSSAVRTSCFGPRHAPAAVSHMAGVLLTGVKLPHEGYGHVMLGGPGPLLMYRVSEAHVRLCLDVPASNGARSTEALWHGFGPVLPETLRHAFRDALEHGKVVWAANRLSPRSDYGEGNVALVGDAVGTTHPLAAAGMTLGILDAVTLVESSDVARYATARARSSRVPEVLSQALYEVVSRDDESASGVRDAMVRMWRGSAYERERTMRILAGHEQRPLAFASAFTKVAGGALRHAVASNDLQLLGRMKRAGGLREWARYPLTVAGSGAMPAPRTSFHGPEHDAQSLEQLAWSISGSVAAGQWARAPRVRRTLRALLRKLDLLDAATLADGPVTRAERTRTVARVLNALLDARCPDTEAMASVVERLVCAAPYDVSVASEAERALRRYREHAKAAPRVQRPALRTNADGGLAGADWDFCQAALEGVSRSFAQPIAALPPTLRVAVTCGYLLCRVADTIEDAPHVSAAERDAHFDRFVAALEGRKRATEFERELDGWPGTEAELQLAAGLARVIRVLDAAPPGMAVIVRRWVGEMVRGMRVYTHREAGHDGLHAPLTVSDLERYCYFVAGTVGHMLTELFLAHMGPSAGPTGGALERTLRSRAESFGAGLQLVNILKDVTDDRARGWAFVPRELADLDDLTHRSIAPLFDLARTKLDQALEYTLAIPSEQLGVRIFCLLPVFMAARTLMLARGNDDVFTPGRPVKIPRREVDQLAADCLALATHDDLLRTAYAALWQPSLPARPTRKTAQKRGDHV